jgi:hypothetical protein
MILVLGIFGGFYYYTQDYLQPNIQVTNLNISAPVTIPQTSVVVNEGRVFGSGSFDFTPSLAGTYDMVFNNSFSFIATKHVSVNYSAGGTSSSPSLVIPAGLSTTVGVVLSPSEQLDGTFQVSGGAGNDINFEIVANTCMQKVSFSFTLVNVGTSSDFANVSLTAGGKSFWTNRYLIPSGQKVSESGQTNIPDCISRSYNVTIVSVTKG